MELSPKPKLPARSVFAPHSEDEIKKSRELIRKAINREEGRFRMSIRGIIDAFSSIIQPSTGSKESIGQLPYKSPDSK